MNTQRSEHEPPEIVAALGSDGIPWYYRPLPDVLDHIRDLHGEFGGSYIGVPVVHLWAVRSEGLDTDPVFVLQRRSDNHKLDKTVGGHVSDRHDYSPDQAVAHEVSEEMGGVYIEFRKRLGGAVLTGARGKHGEDTAVIYRMGDPRWVNSGRHDRKGYYEKPTLLHTYVGVYDGPLETIVHDDEVTEFVEMPYSQICNMLEEDPEAFTPDARDLIHGIAQQIMGREPDQPDNTA